MGETYAKDSVASNRTALSDAYVKFFRWATDRLQGRDGIVCFVSNNGFVRGVAFDGFRKHLLRDFNSIFHFDFKGNARTTGERRREEGGNIFSDQIRTGVGITVLVRNGGKSSPSVFYHCVPDHWKAPQKTAHLSSFGRLSEVSWKALSVDARGDWLLLGNAAEYLKLVPLGSKGVKSMDGSGSGTEALVFSSFSIGVKTNRDEVVYDFQEDALAKRVRQFVEDYNSEVDRYKRSDEKTPVDDFVRYENIKWSRDLKLDLERGHSAVFDGTKLRTSLYRAYCKRKLFFDRVLNEEVYGMPRIFPNPATENENRLICCTIDSQIAFSALMTGIIPSHAPGGRPGQCFPFYFYNEDGTNRRENVTNWALEHFCGHYNDRQITKWDIFYYVYGILHHPEYRAKYAENLKRELPRIPLANDFWGFSKAGKELAGLHIDYEKVEPWPLKFIETTDVAAALRRHGEGNSPPQQAERRSALQIPLSYCVEDKMRLAKDRRSLKVNDSLTLGGIPPETFEYRLGNRSALEWVIDQYQVTEDRHSGIRSDPNRPDDPEYIVRLVGQVIRVSLETVKLVKSLPAL